MFKPISMLVSAVLFAIGVTLFMSLPLVGNRLLTHLGGTPLAWSLTLLGFAACWFLGSAIAMGVHFLRSRWMQAAVFAGLFALGGAWLVLGSVPQYPATEWGDHPIRLGLVAFFLSYGLACIPLAAAAVFLGSQLAIADPDRWTLAGVFGFFFLGGAAGLAALTMGLEPHFGRSALIPALKIAYAALAVGTLLLTPFLTPAQATPRDSRIGLSLPFELTWKVRAFWFLAGFVPLALLIGQMRYTTLDIAPSTVFWAGPLAAFLAAAAQGFAQMRLTNRAPLVVRILLYVAPIVPLGVTAFLFFWPVTSDVWWAAVFVGVFMLTPPSWAIVLQPIAVVFALPSMMPPWSYHPEQIVAQMVAVYLTTRTIFWAVNESAPSGRSSLSMHFWLATGSFAGTAFQVLAAPYVFFRGEYEYPLIFVLGCALRPAWMRYGFTDLLLFQIVPRARTAKEEASRRYLLSWICDGAVCLVAIGMVLGALWLGKSIAAGPFRPDESQAWFRIREASGIILGALVALFLAARPLRSSVALAVVVLASPFFKSLDRVETVQRTNFATYRLYADSEFEFNTQFDYLMNGTTYHGRQYHEPRELSRMATTYFHARGPVGKVMDRYRWFRNIPEAQSDARIVASIVGLGAIGTMGSSANVDAVLAAYSEPPIAMIGMDVGALAAYVRPFQRLDFFELDPKVEDFGSPSGGRRFTFVKEARERGALVRIFHGDPRQALRENAPEKFYKVFCVAAFNSDAIPAHYITSEALADYERVLAPDGIVMFHTSNRHLDLPPIVQAAALARKWDSAIAHDEGGDRSQRNRGQQKVDELAWFSSEWVAVAPREATIDSLLHFRQIRRQRPFGGPGEEALFRRTRNPAAALHDDGAIVFPYRGREYVTIVEVFLIGACFVVVVGGVMETLALFLPRAPNPTWETLVGNEPTIDERDDRPPPRRRRRSFDEDREGTPRPLPPTGFVGEDDSAR